MIYKFVQHEVPAIESLADSKVYRIYKKLEHGEKLTRDEKNWITAKIEGKCIRLMGWAFDFSEYLRRYFIRDSFGYWRERYAIDKTSLRACTYPAQRREIICIP